MPDVAVSPLQEHPEQLEFPNRTRPDQLQTHLGPPVTVPINSLQAAGFLRVAGEIAEHVRSLAAAVPDDLPPIIVHRATMKVIDGLHRVKAAKLRRQTEITARFFDGEEADAFVLAVQANRAHGLPLSLADRKAAAARIITSHPHWSDRLIASVAGVSPKTVADVRRSGDGKILQPGVRLGQDGRIRPMNSLEKRQIAGNLMLDNPNLSLRQVARAVGISPETARAVRARLLVGEDPVPPRPVKKAGKQPHAARPGRSQPSEPAHLTTDWMLVVRRLRTDPALRFTDTGRTLLRLLDMHAMSNNQWTTLVSNVPPHSRPAIAKVAMECARIWRVFAEHMERDAPPP